ncbi:MAG TPA: hypothetical protein VFX70_03370 [Mycobacteriales bacterium]|nr:hypothetical protein [Mycobacteriales bacterium]
MAGTPVIRRIPDPAGGGGRINVTPRDIASVAKRFATAQNELYQTWARLQATLQANTGMAGDDQAARRFNARYAPAVRTAWAALRSSLLTLGGISTGLTRTANNFLVADHDSAPGGPTPPTLAAEAVIDDVLMAGADPATGPGETVWFLPGPLSRFWPNAHTDRLRVAARAWHQAAESVDVLTRGAQSALTSLEVDDDTTQAVNGFWAQVYRPGVNRTVLAGTHQICRSLGDACARYADVVDAKRGEVSDKLLGAEIAVGVTSALGVLGTVFAGGNFGRVAVLADEAELRAIVGDVPAETSAAVQAEVSAAVSGDLVATVAIAATEAPAVEAAEAETARVQGDIEGSLDRAMAAEEGDVNLTRLSDAAAGTLTRARLEYPDRGLRVQDPSEVGEYVDDRGRNYTRLGDPATSRRWNPRSATRFYRAVDQRLGTPADFTVIDLTGFGDQSISDIRGYLDTLPEAEQARIIRIGF